MTTQHFLTDPVTIRAWLREHCVIDGSCDILPNGHVTVTGSVLLHTGNPIEALAVQFEEVTGYFDCSRTQLKTLHGSPFRVGRYFHCVSCNQLESLNGAPVYVGLDFYADSCERLRSLEGAVEIAGQLSVDNCEDHLDFSKYIPKCKRIMYNHYQRQPEPHVLRELVQRPNGVSGNGTSIPWIDMLLEFYQTGNVLEMARTFNELTGADYFQSDLVQPTDIGSLPLAP